MKRYRYHPSSVFFFVKGIFHNDIFDTHFLHQSIPPQSHTCGLNKFLWVIRTLSLQNLFPPLKMVKEQSSSYFINKEINQTISVLLIVHILWLLCKWKLQMYFLTKFCTSCIVTSFVYCALSVYSYQWLKSEPNLIKMLHVANLHSAARTEKFSLPWD